MRWSQYYLYTTREVPADAEVVSHRLMIRAGMIKKVAAGIYTYLPFGWRSLQKLMTIVRRELDKSGAVELSMPCVQPAELWQESGRWSQYGKELLRIDDRHEREFCFGPTHEEVITDLVGNELSSYRQLPVNLYQIGTKFRDEIRPRFGLMRGREFLMKDAYSFHATPESLSETYLAMDQAYRRIFEACKLDYIRVEADSGAIGGSDSHEFMVVAETGESAVVRSPEGDYAANVEKAVIGDLEAPPALAEEQMREVHTPGQAAVEDVAKFLGVEPRQMVKTLLYETDKGPVAALVRGDREINEVKLKNVLDLQFLQLASEEVVREITGAEVGYAGPVGLDADAVQVLADPTVEAMSNFACGANKTDAHLVGVQFGRDLPLPRVEDLLLVGGGDASPDGGGALEEFRGIEVGHIFKLGTKYSEAMNCTYTDDTGADSPMTMGCYGLGIGRTVAAAIEQNHDENGIIWPVPLAPFEVLLIALNPQDETVRDEAERIYADLQERNIDVLFDDRQERPGVKFNDADLIGVPVRIVVGARSLAEGNVELSLRHDREKLPVAKADVVAKAAQLLAGL